MSEEAVKRIPYGLSDYEKIRKGNYYYVDKTGYLRDIERAGDYLFFIRPRRFGKSLFVSMIETYYDIAGKDQFDFFFDGTDILRRPTPQRSGFLILTFNFSAVASAPGHVERSFFDYVVEVADRFLFKYKDRLTLHDPHQYTNELKQKATASDVLRSLIGLCEKSGQQLYLIIDEYDNFANTILSTSGSGDYWDLTHGESFFRTFFNVIKSGTTGSGAALSRLFITGVSPITMDDLTSGFNIGKNISTDADFNPMLGFTHDDVTAMIDYYRQAGWIRHQTHDLLELMKQWYNHYVFSRKTSTPLFNADMVLYFLDEYFKEHDLPEELVDRNVRIDYDKLRHLITVDKRGQKEVNGNFLKLREIVEEGKARSKLVKGFPLEEMDSSENFVSLLFYLGLLTIGGEEEGLVQFQIPNRTVKALYYDYIIRVGNETGLISLDLGKIDALLHGMAYHGDWKGFFAYISQRMSASTSLRDFIREEKVIQGFLLAWMGISDYFLVQSERELNRGYGDILLEPFFNRYPDIRYSYLLEIKYLKADDRERNREEKVARLREEAEQQLKRYHQDENLARRLGSTTLIKLVLIFSATDLEYIGEVP